MHFRKRDFTVIPYISLAAIIAGLFMSRAMPSVGMIILAGYALLVPERKQILQQFLKDRVLVTLTLIFVVYLLSAINSTEDREFLNERIRIKLPFLVMPFSMLVFRNRLSSRQFQALLFFFVMLVVITSLIVTVGFYRNFDTILESYNHGKTVDTPFSHVRYSLMVAFAAIAAMYLFFHRFYLQYPTERWILLAAAAFLVFFLHLMAVRSGMLALYLCIVYFSLYLMFRLKNWKSSLLLLVAVISLPVIAYLSLPSLQMKFQYMRTDLEQLLKHGNAAGYSDGGRILSIQTGLELFRENWITGVGIGDLQQEMNRKLKAMPEHPNDILLPHNQFVYVAAGTGLLGLLIFTAAVLMPFTRKRCYKDPLFMCFSIILLSSFLTDPTIEEQIGTAFYLTFLLLIYNQLSSRQA